MSSDPQITGPVEEQSAHQSGDQRKRRVRKKVHRHNRLGRKQAIYVVIAAGIILMTLGAWYFLANLFD